MKKQNIVIDPEVILILRLSNFPKFHGSILFLLNKLLKIFNMYPSVVFCSLLLPILSTCCRSLFIFSFYVLSHQFAEFLLEVWLETLCCLYQLQYLVLPYASVFTLYYFVELQFIIFKLVKFIDYFLLVNAFSVPFKKFPSSAVMKILSLF